MMRNDELIAAITRDFNDLCHHGVPGQEWYVNKAERYQNHAKYARGNPKYADKYMQAAKERMNQEHYFTDSRYSSFTKNDIEIPYEKLSEIKRLDGSKSIEQVRMDINHPDDATQQGRGYNCPNCALAFEMTERGYDVVARPKVYRSNVENVEDFFKGGRLTPMMPDDNPFNITEKYDAWKSFSDKYQNSLFKTQTAREKRHKLKADYWDAVGKAVKQSCDKTIAAIESQGNGARGIIVQGFMAYNDPRKRTTGYHAFNYKVENGKVKFYDVEGRNKDQQNGKSWIEVDAIDPRELYIMRTDNLQLSPTCTRGVYSNRGIKY